MNDNAINDLFSYAQSLGYKDSRDKFINLIHTDQRAFNDMFSYARSKGFNKSEDDFAVLIGKSKPTPGKPLPGSGAGASGGLRLPSNLSKQQVKSYLGKYGASFTDAQYEQIASEARGKSLDEAIRIATQITTPTSQPAQMSPLDAGRKMLESAGSQRTGIAEQTQADIDEITPLRGYLSPEQLGGAAAEDARIPSATMPTLGEQRADFATQFRQQGSANAADVVARAKPISKTSLLAKYAEEAKQNESEELNLGPFGTVKLGETPEEIQRNLDQLITLGDPNSTEAQYGFNSQQIYDELKSNLGYESDKKLEEDLLKYFKSNEGLKYVIDDSKQKLSIYNQQYEELLQNPDASAEDIAALKKEISKELTIQAMGDIVDRAQYEKLSLSDKASVGLAYGGNVLRSVANDLELSYNELIVDIMEMVYEPFMDPQHKGIIRDVALFPVLQEKRSIEEKRQELPYQSVSSQSVIDGLNILNFSTTATQVTSSMAVTYFGGWLGGAALIYGDAVDEARKAGFDLNEAKAYGLINASISGILEKIGLKGMTKTITTDAEKRLILSAIRSELKKGKGIDEVVSIVTNKMANSVGSLIKAGAPESITEFAQTGQELVLKKTFNEIVLDESEREKKGFKEPTLDEASKMLAESLVIGFFSAGSVPAIVSGFSRSNKKYDDVAKAVVDGKKSVSSIVETTKGLILSGKVSAADGRAFIENLKIAEAAKASLPKYVKDKQQRTRAISLIMERNKLNEEMSSADSDLQDGYKQRLGEIKQELKSIADKNWVAPTIPFTASTSPGFSAAINALSQEPDTDKAARVFNKTLGVNNGLLTKLMKAMESGAEIATRLSQNVVSDLEVFVDKLSSMDNKTPAMKDAIKAATDIIQKLSDYRNKRDDVSVVGSLNIDETIGRIAAGADPADMDFMENVPEETLAQVAEAIAGIQDGMDVSEQDAETAANFLYERYKQLVDLKTKIKGRIDSETDKTKKDRLERSISAIDEVLSKLNEDIGITVKYQQEKALQDEAAGTRKQIPLGQPKQEQAPAPTPAQEFDPRNIDQVADDYQQKTGDALTGVMATALKTVAKLLAKVAPNVKFYVHSTTQEFLDAVKQEGVNEDLSNNAGTVVQSNDGTPESIHINLELALSESTAKAAKYVYHEAAHVLLAVYFRSDKYRGADLNLIFDMAKAIRSALPSKYKGPLAEFVGRYKDKLVYEQEEEFIAELIDMLANDEASLDKPTIAKIIAVINDFITAACEKFGVDPEKFLLSNNRADLIDFVNSTSRAVKSGLSSDLSEKATTRLQRKYAVQEQAAGEVPVQSRTKAGRTLAKGESKAEPQKTTQEGSKEEVESSRNAEVLFTTATLRRISEITNNLADLTTEYDIAVKKLPDMTQDVFGTEGAKIVRAIKNLSSEILDYYESFISEISKVIGVKFNSGNYYLGSWNGFFEPSMNISFDITDDTNTQVLSDLFNKLAEQTSQDAFIIEAVAKQNEEFQKTGEIILFTTLEDGTSIYPQVRIEFKDDLSVSEKAGIAKILSGEKFEAFSIGDNFVKMSSFASDVAGYESEKSKFENAIKNSEYSDLYSKTTEQIKQSNYISAEQDGDKRKYNRGDIFEAFKPSAGKSTAKQTKSGRTGGILREGGKEGGSLAPLEGAPFIQGATGPDPNLVAVAEQYAKDNGINLKRQAEYVQIDEDRARRIAAAYEEMVSDPSDPKVKKAYRELIDQTKKQYDALVKAGYEFTFFDSESDPYDGNPKSAMRDLRANKKMAVYGTYDGYGTDGITTTEIENNPMLEDTGLKWKDQSGELKPVTANDLFRAVHDAFGHGLEGASFRARGEENAWQAHVRLFTGDAIAAITTETRGQNSWLNYGPYGESNRTAKVNETVFAENKIGLLPEWTWTEGRAGDMEQEAPAPGKKTKAGRVGSALADVKSTARALEALVKDKVKTPNDIPNTMGTHLQNITDGAWLIRDGDKSKEWVDLVNNAIKEIENVFSVIPYSGKTQKAFSSIKNKVKNDNYDISKEVSELSSATKKEFYKGGEGWGVNEISEAYHKAKADGSNPELVQAVEDLVEPQPGKKTKAGRTKAGSFKNGYDPNEAADRGNQDDRDLQKRIYDAALEVWDSTKDLMDLSADIYEAVSDKLGIGLNPIHIGELVKDLRTGNRPEYSKTPDGKYKRSKTRLREGAVMTSALEALERLATDRRVNKGIISSLTKALKGGPQYTVEGQMDIESIADALFDIFGGSTNLTALQELYNIAEITKGGLRSFMFARIANDAWNKARESKDQQEKLEYRNIGNKAVMQLGQEATEAGRFNAMIYRIQKLNPEFLAAYQKTHVREETESQMRSSGKKKSSVISATTALNTAQTQASEQAVNSPSVQAAINTATGTPPTTSTQPPAPKTKPTAPKPAAPKATPSATKVIDDRIKELKGKLKNLFSGKKTKAARVLPAGMNPEILDIITELARNYIQKGMTDRTALISKINGDVIAAGGSITMDYFTEMWNEVQADAVKQRNTDAATSLANRVVGKVKGAIRPSSKTFDPIAELITELVNKATEDVKIPARAKESPLEKIKRLLVEYDTAKNIWEASKAKVEAKIDGLDPARFTLSEKAEMKNMLDSFFDNDLSYFEIKKTSTPSPDATVRNAIKQEMKDKKLKIEEILLTANSKKAATRDQFIQNIVDDIVYSTGISYNQAIKIAEDFTRKYDQIVTQKQESILKRYSSQRRVNNIKKKSQGQRAFEMIKYGALDPSIEIHDKDGNIIDSAMLLAEIFGIPYLDQEARDMLDGFAEVIADTPEGIIRQQVINDMMLAMKMHYYRQLGSLGDRIMSQFYANLLTSTDTLLKAFNSNVLMNPFEYLSIATRAAVKGDFALIPLLTRGFYQQKGVGSVKELKATKTMSDVDGYVINNGESYYLFNDKTIMSLANPKAVALSSHYEGLLRYSASINQARGVLENIVLHENFTNNVTGAVYEKYAKSRSGRAWGKYVTIAQKGLGALDALVTAGATDARYSDLLFDAIRHYAKINGQKIKGSEIVKIINLLKGYSPMVQLDAYNQAIAEMEIVEGGQVDLSDRKKKTLLLLRVEEIVREKMKDRYQQAVNEYPWLSGLEQQEIADMLDEAGEISTKLGLMGTPPGTSGVLSHLLGLPGKTVRFSNMQYGAFAKAPVNAANFLLQGNTPLAAFILSVRLLKSERGLGLGSNEFFKREGIRTKMYGKTSYQKSLSGNQSLSLKWNLEKQDLITKFVLIQAPVITMTFMASNAVMVALASMFDDDDDRDKLLKDGIGFLRTIPQKDRELMFFGDPLSPDPKKKAGIWKTLPFYATGAMYGYSDGGYGKMQSLRARFGVEPYTVYSYGRKIFSYKDNPLLGAFFMEMAAATDAMLFNETADLEDTQLGMIMASTWSQMNLIRDQSNLRSISEVVELLAGQRAYEGLDGYNARAQMYLSKTSANILNNLALPAEMKNLNQDIMAMIGQYMDDPKQFHEFVVYRWPIIGNAVIEGDKTGPFGYPLKMQPKRVFPIGTEQFKLPLMLDGSLDVPTVDQLLSTEDAAYTALFERNKNDKFLKPGISGYYKLNKYGDYERETFTLEEQKKIREEYKLLMREFAEENIGLTQSPKEFDIKLKIFLGQYGAETGKNRVQTTGYKRYIVNKVMGSKASDILLDEADGLYNMNEDQLILDKIKQTEEGFEPLPR